MVILLMILASASSDTALPACDREVIRVDFADDRMGIAAALRRAFHAAACARSDHDFEKLLRDLN
ncbi:MAG: hypothetical protein LH465_09245 [Sphingomonas bacterium]|nr:hypothetical protein [Sphingomonas bacterium]